MIVVRRDDKWVRIKSNMGGPKTYNAKTDKISDLPIFNTDRKSVK